MPKIESEKIDCLHRPCSRPGPQGKIKSVRTHSEVIEQFDSFSLLKLLFLVRNWHCWSRKAFTRQMTPQIREEINLFAGRAVKRERRKGSSRRQQPAYGAAVNEVARELLRSARSPKRENGGRRYIKHDGMIASPVGSCLCC